MTTSALAVQEPFSGRAHEILTPEGVTLQFAIARAGDRLGAFFLDALIIMVASFVLVIMALAATDGMRADGWLWAFVVLGIFLLQSGYFIWFESRGRGTTPGKRRMGIRIMDSEGGTLTVGAIVVRNVMRILEVHVALIALLAPEVFWAAAPGWARLLAAGWLLVITGMPLFNHRRLRVGDMVAGTIVVASPTVRLERDVGAQAVPRARKRDEPAFTFTREQLDVYGNYELQVLEDVLRRGSARKSDDMILAVAERIAGKIAARERIRRKTARPFLQAFYVALRGRLEQRMLFGQRKEDKHSD